MTTLLLTADKIGLASIADWFKRLDAWFTNRRQTKKIIKQLSALTDRELWDMGITRGDIHAIAHGTYTINKTRTERVL